MVSSHIKELVEAEIEILCVLAQNNKVMITPSDFSIDYDLKGTSLFGQACWEDKEKGKPTRIRLHAPLITENPELYIQMILAHEFAHIMVMWNKKNGAYDNRRVKPHGREFRECCEVLGLTEEQIEGRTHRFADSPYLDTLIKKRIYSFWVCGCEGKEHPMKKGEHESGRLYQCRKCFKNLTFKRLS